MLRGRGRPRDRRQDAGATVEIDGAAGVLARQTGEMPVPPHHPSNTNRSLTTKLRIEHVAIVKMFATK
jgi:hypothetical protein